MKEQFDNKVRIVSVENLKAMCAFVSGMCHRFKVVKVTKQFATVSYSNPDEYGNEYTIYAKYPVVPYSNSIGVILEMHNCTKDPRFPDQEEWQSFITLTDCPTLWRHPNGTDWQAYDGLTPIGHKLTLND